MYILPRIAELTRGNKFAYICHVNSDVSSLVDICYKTRDVSIIFKCENCILLTTYIEAINVQLQITGINPRIYPKTPKIILKKKTHWRITLQLFSTGQCRYWSRDGDVVKTFLSGALAVTYLMRPWTWELQATRVIVDDEWYEVNFRERRC